MPSALLETRYAGYVMDSTGGLEVSVATRANDTGMDPSQWAFGEDRKGMEEAREIIRWFLHRQWRRRLDREVESIFRVLGWSERDEHRNRLAAWDCLERSGLSSWREFQDGSWLYFWRWPQDIWREARDGRKFYRLYEPTKRQHFTFFLPTIERGTRSANASSSIHTCMTMMVTVSEEPPPEPQMRHDEGPAESEEEVTLKTLFTMLIDIRDEIHG